MVDIDRSLSVIPVTLSSTFAAGSVVLLLYYLTAAIYSVYFHPLSKFPGPKITAFSRLPFIWSTITGTTWQYLEKLHVQYGPVVRIAPDELTTTRSAAWKDIYTTRPFLDKDPFSQTPPMNGADSLFTASGETHNRLRRTFINAFSDKALRDQSPIIESYAKLLMIRLRREIGKSRGGPIDMAKYYGYATLDIIADLTFGESFYGLEGDNEHSWILGFFLGAKFGSVRNSLSRFSPLDKIFSWFFLRLTAKNRARSWQVATDRITRRLEMGDLGSTRSDFITPVIGKVETHEKVSISRKELNTNGLAVVIAGCQLTTIALATATYLLCRYPETLEQLRRELRSTFDTDDQISVASTQNLPYLIAVIDETLRIHHPTPINLPRKVLPEGQVVDGQFIPGGTIIGINLQNVQNSTTNWIEPRVFHPERFLPQSDPRYDSRFDQDDKQAFQPFAVGPRNCMGGKVFLAEARVILSKMVFNFEMQLVNPTDDDWMKQKAYLVFEPKALPLKLVEKEADVGGETLEKSGNSEIKAG